MQHFTPTLFSKETGKNVRGFVKEHNDELLKIIKPLAPFIAGLYLFDAIISEFFFTQSEHEFSLGMILATYFYMCLVISWHRVVIKGPENYTPMNPFKPKRHELAFIGVGILIGILILIVAVVFVGSAAFMQSGVMGVVAAIAIVAAIYASYRLMFYFPAKAVGASITLREAFDMTKGYLWKIICASFRASIRLVLIALLYSMILAGLSFSYAYIAHTVSGAYLLGFILGLPLILYIQPLLTVLGVTVLSNYYLHAVQNPKGE